MAKKLGSKHDMLSEKRQAVKYERKYGKKYITKLGINEIAWCRKNDPYFQIKGIERHRLVKGYNWNRFK